MIININTKEKYNIEIKKHLMKDIAKRLKDSSFSDCKICIVTDSNLDKLYAPSLENSLVQENFEVYKLVFEPGESIKSLGNAEQLLNHLAEKKFTKSDIIIALGGGSVGDLAGFVASIYNRGMPYIHVPTTLLSAVDSSVGGKTGVNLSYGKNLVGSFWQPKGVYFDTATLESLSKMEILNGIVEIIKAGIIDDPSIFELFETNEPSEINNFIQEALIKAIMVKKSLVEIDEKDDGPRRKLNLGHTIGHAIENESHYKLPHGKSVAVGILAMAKISEKNNIAKAPLYQRIKNLFDKYEIDTSYPLNVERIANMAKLDKKRHSSYITLVIPEKIGSCKLQDVPFQQLENLLKTGFGN